MVNQLCSTNVVGRDQLIAQLWTLLQNHSLRFTAERRVGKTTVMLKLHDQPAHNFQPLFIDLEKISSPTHFVEALLQSAHAHNLLSRSAQALKSWQSLLRQLGGLEIAGMIKLPTDSRQHWSATLDTVLHELCQQPDHRRPLLLLDELPYMLQRFATDGCPADALLLLDCLRAARQKYPGLRMIFAGSIGLHHVLRELRQQTLASEPLNDLPAVEIRGLEMAAACQLARQQLHNYQLQLAPDQAPAVLERIALRTDGVPFYVAALVSHLASHADPVTPQSVDLVVRHLLTADTDPWEMEHFRSRLPAYYRGTISDANGRLIPQCHIASELLDHFALADQPLSINHAWTAMRSRFALTDRQYLVQLLRSLAQDHYLVSSSDKLYSFRFPLIRSWWRIAHGLES